MLLALPGGSPGLVLTCRVGHTLGFLQGWLAAPLTCLLPLLVFLCIRGTPILAGVIGVARLVVGLFLFILFWLLGHICVSALLVTRLG